MLGSSSGPVTEQAWKCNSGRLSEPPQNGGQSIQDLMRMYQVFKVLHASSNPRMLRSVQRSEMEFLGQFCPARTSSLQDKVRKERIPWSFKATARFTNIDWFCPYFFHLQTKSRLFKTRERLTSETVKAFYLNVGLPGKNGYFNDARRVHANPTLCATLPATDFHVLTCFQQPLTINLKPGNGPWRNLELHEGTLKNTITPSRWD